MLVPLVRNRFCGWKQQEPRLDVGVLQLVL